MKDWFKLHFIKRPLMLIKTMWVNLVFDMIDDENLTVAGQIVLLILLSAFMTIFTVLTVICMPLYLIIMKYDEEIGM